MFYCSSVDIIFPHRALTGKTLKLKEGVLPKGISTEGSTGQNVSKECRDVMQPKSSQQSLGALIQRVLASGRQ